MDGLDDFSDGLPPESDGEMVIKERSDLNKYFDLLYFFSVNFSLKLMKS